MTRPAMSRMSIPAPKKTISSPEMRLISFRFSLPILERTEPIEPHRTIHQIVEPMKTPATNSAAAITDVPWNMYRTPAG